MLKRARLLIVALIVTALFVGTAVYAQTGTGTFKGFPIVNIILNGKKLQGDVPAIMFEGRTLVPLRLVSEAFGVNLEWDGGTNTIKMAGEFSPAEMEKTKTELGITRAQLADANAKIQQAKSDVEGLKGQLARADQAKKDLEAKIAELEKKILDNQSEIEGLKKLTGGIWTTLTSSQIREAIKYGTARAATDQAALLAPWTVTNGKDSATLLTEFAWVSDRARKDAVLNRDTTEESARNLIAPFGSELLFQVEVYGDSIGFAEGFLGTLSQGDVILQPTRTENEKTASPSRYFPGSPAYKAINVYQFPHGQLDLNSPVTLKIVSPAGKESVFEFNLRVMR